MSAKMTTTAERKLAILRAAIARCPQPLRDAVLGALQADVKDSELGRVVRLGALDTAQVTK